MDFRKILTNTVLYYLKLMDKNYYYDDENDRIVIEEEVEGEKEKIIVRIEDPWVRTMYIGPSIKNLNDELKFKIMQKLLTLNFGTREMKFALDKNERIIVSVESHVLGLTLDNFYMEYGAIPYAIKFLKEEVFPLIEGLTIKKEEEKEKEAPSIDPIQVLLKAIKEKEKEST